MSASTERAKIAPSLRDLVVPIDSLRPDPANARAHPRRNLEAVAESLRRFGQVKPIVVDAEGVVRAGNATLACAIELGWTEIAVVRTSLSGIEAAAFGVADNRTAELGGWNYEELARQFRQLGDVSSDLVHSTGFADYEVQPLLAADWSPSETAPPSESDDGDRRRVIKLSGAQREAFDRARSALEKERGEELDDGQALRVMSDRRASS